MSSMKPNSESVDLTLIRQHNTALVLSYLRLYPSQTRAALAAQTGLTRATVSSLVEDLIKRELVIETGMEASRAGRPGTLLELNPQGAGVIGVEIQCDFVLIVLTDFCAQVRWQKRVTIDCTDMESVLAIAEEMVEEALARSRAAQLPPLGIGVGLPGLVDIDSGTLLIAPNLRWHNVPIRSLWETRFSLPVLVHNEASAAALGESYFGVARNETDFIFLDTSMRGLGGGVFLNGRLFVGPNGYAGEVGHMVIQGQSGVQCSCGRVGCWETLVNGDTILDRVRQQLAQGVVSLLPELLDNRLDKLSLDTLAQASAAGDLLATKELIYISDVMGMGIANLVNTFNPHLIVLSGPVAYAIESFLPVVQAAVNEQIMYPFARVIHIKMSSLRAEACVMGAIAMVLDQFYRTLSW
jgi:predicted NBD/HSP70 family sugar kinase